MKKYRGKYQKGGTAWYMRRQDRDNMQLPKQVVDTPAIQEADNRRAEAFRRRTIIDQDNRTPQQKRIDEEAFLRRKKMEEDQGKDFTTPTSLQERNRAQSERIIHNMVDVPTTVMGAGELAYGVGKFAAKQLPKVGEYLTTQTPLKNTWQLNPFANKLGQYNRIVGQDAILDLQQSGLVRSGKGAPTTIGEININRPTRYPSFAKGAPRQTYLNQVQETGQTPFIISTDRSMGVSTLGRHGKGTTQFPIDESGNYLTSFPANEVKVYEGTPHWLKGYKEVPKPTSSQQITRGFIDWADTPGFMERNPKFNPRKYENWIKPKTDFSAPFDPNLKINKKGGPIVSKYGQWKYPGQETIVPTEDGTITMDGVPYPVLGIDETGYKQMMYPNQQYKYRGKRVYEIPIMQDGGRTPIYTNDPNDPRLRAYNDSLTLYNYGNSLVNKTRKWFAGDDNSKTGFDESVLRTEKIQNMSVQEAKELMKKEKKIVLKPHNTGIKGIDPVSAKVMSYVLPYMNNKMVNNYLPIYKKPVQPVIYQQQPDLNMVGADRPTTSSFIGNIPAPVDRSIAPIQTEFSATWGEDGKQETRYFPNFNSWKTFDEMRMPGWMHSQSTGDKSSGHTTLQGTPQFQDGGLFDVQNFLFDDDEEEQTSPQVQTKPNEIPVEDFVQSRYEDFKRRTQEENEFDPMNLLFMDLPESSRHVNPYRTNSYRSTGANPYAEKTQQELINKYNLRNLGIWGDASHQMRKSDHNTGDAGDLGITNSEQTGQIFNELTNSWKERKIKYIIHNGKIWNPSISNEWRPYSGSNPHKNHIHISYNR